MNPGIMDRIMDRLVRLQDNHVHWYLLVVGVVLILIDYYFRTDLPAYLAYFVFGIVVFFMVSFTPAMSAVAGVATWLGLNILHWTWFGKYLHTIHDVRRISQTPGAVPSAPSPPPSNST